MITITTTTLIIIGLSFVGAAGWVLGYKEYLFRVRSLKEAEVARRVMEESLNASLQAALDIKEAELEEVEGLVRGKVGEIEKAYKEVLEEQNQSLELYESYIRNFDAAITLTSKKLKDLDDKGVFASDDEIGFFFTYVNGLQNILEKFKIEKEVLDNRYEEAQVNKG